MWWFRYVVDYPRCWGIIIPHSGSTHIGLYMGRMMLRLYTRDYMFSQKWLLRLYAQSGVVLPIFSKSPLRRTDAKASRGSPSKQTPRKSNEREAPEGPASEVPRKEVPPKGVSLGTEVLGSTVVRSSGSSPWRSSSNPGVGLLKKASGETNLDASVNSSSCV